MENALMLSYTVKGHKDQYCEKVKQRTKPSWQSLKRRALFFGSDFA